MIRAIYTGSDFLESAAGGDEVGIVLESTSFYAEQGGQVYVFSIYVKITFGCDVTGGTYRRF